MRLFYQRSNKSKWIYGSFRVLIKQDEKRFMTPIVPERSIHTNFVKNMGSKSSKKGIFKCYRGKFKKIYNFDQFNISLCISHSKPINKKCSIFFRKNHSSNFRNFKPKHQTRHRQITEQLDNIELSPLMSVFVGNLALPPLMFQLEIFDIIIF